MIDKHSEILQLLTHVSLTKIQLHMTLHVILHLARAMESRPLSPEERDIRTRLKRRDIGLAAL
jgi:hypothetical protein